MQIQDNQLRTSPTNEAVRLIYMINKDLEENKKGQSDDLSTLSSQVVLSGQFSNHFLADLRKFVLKDNY